MKKTGLVVILVLSLLNPAVGRYHNDDSWWDWALDNKCAIAGAVVTGVFAPYAAPALVAGMGFGAGGIAAGSTAASMMSAAAVANGGGVVAGGAVAVLQSIGAVGLGAAGTAGAVGAGAGVGAMVGKVTCTENCRKNEN